MVNLLSNWAKNIGFAIVIVSIIEMILPNNNTKKYIKMVLGTYVLFCMISPFIKNKIDFENINLEQYEETSSTTFNEEKNQESMNRRIEQLYIEQMEKEITKKVGEQGYKVKKCEVDATITDDADSTKINKVILKVDLDSSQQKAELLNFLKNEYEVSEKCWVIN